MYLILETVPSRSVRNGQPMRLDYVQQFEERCQTSIAAGRWWVDLDTGSLGLVGGPAIYNINTCQSLGAEMPREKNTEDKCTFSQRRLYL